MPKHLEGELVSDGQTFAVVVARFNEHVTQNLLDGAVDTLERHGVDPDDITVVHVPGSWEIPVAAKKCAGSGEFDAVVCLGAVIRGETPHFDYVCSGVTSGTMQASVETEVPTTFGILTTDTVEQAVARSGSKAGNKGREAAEAAIEMVNVMSQL